MTNPVAYPWVGAQYQAHVPLLAKKWGPKRAAKNVWQPLLVVGTSVQKCWTKKTTWKKSEDPICFHDWSETFFSTCATPPPASKPRLRHCICKTSISFFITLYQMTLLTLLFSVVPTKETASKDRFCLKTLPTWNRAFDYRRLVFWRQWPIQ